MSHRAPRSVAASAIAPLALAIVLASPPALAQDAEAPPSPEEIRKKVVEIERLMREAEDSLARSLDASSAEAKARRAAKLLDQKARESTGKSAEELRKLAEDPAKEGARDAAEALRRLTEEANEQATEAAEGVRKLLEETKAGGKEASRGIEWILQKAVQQGQSQQSQGDAPPQPGGGKEPKTPKPDPKDGKQKEEPKDPGGAKKPPESQREKPRDPNVEKWLAELPPQVRKAYETQDWDSIPPKWRDMLREWTKKMAEDLEKERK